MWRGSGVAVGSARWKKMGWGLREIRERQRSRNTVAGRCHDILLARKPVVQGPGGLFMRGVSCRARRQCGRPWGTRGEPHGVRAGSLEGKLVEAKQRAEIE